MKEKIIQAYKSTNSRLNLILFIYVISLLVSIVININVGSILSKHLNGTNALVILTQGFDRTVIGDLITNNENWSNGLIATILISSIFYMILSVFLNAGYISSIVTDEKSIRQFLNKGKQYFFPLFGFSILFYITLIMTGTIIGIVYLEFLGDPIADYHTEKPFIYSVITVFIFFLLIASYLFIWSVYARRNYIKGMSFIKSLKQGFVELKSNIKSNTLIIISLGIMLGVLFFLMKELHNYNSGSAWISIIVTLLIMQSIIFTRIWIKQFIISIFCNNHLKN